MFDMLRFHKFHDRLVLDQRVGDPDDPAQYRWLRAYSPLHNVRAGVPYPRTLLLTGDHDDRVVPGHTLKFAAALQAAQAGRDGDDAPAGAPVLVRVETGAGHGAGKPTSKQIAAEADILAFLDAIIAGPKLASPD